MDKTKTNKVEISEKVQSRKNSNSVSSEKQNANYSQLQAHILSMPFNKEYEISKERLTIDKSRLLHSGKFSLIHHGILKLEKETTTIQMEIAVKSIKPNLDVKYLKRLIHEIKLLSYLGSHENIASLLGTVKYELVLLTEYCGKGDLLTHLRKCKNNFNNIWNRNVLVAYKSMIELPQIPMRIENYDGSLEMSTLDLVRWATHIANGMVFLGEKNIVHGDLSAQNILLTSDNVAKITNFGISCQLIQYLGDFEASNYALIPLRTRSIAIECFLDLSFSIQSDIWSFGVTLWEIFTLGKVPYSDTNSFLGFVKKLALGHRPESPDFGNEEIHQLIQDCMSKFPERRPSFSKIRTQIQLIESNLNVVTFSKNFKRQNAIIVRKDVIV